MSDESRPWFPLLAGLAALTGIFLLFEITDLDIAIQDNFFDVATGTWLVDAKEPIGRAMFYNGPKYGIIATALALLVLGAGPVSWRSKLAFDRRGIWIALLTLITVPSIVGASKATTNVFCPSEIRRYGGDVAYVKVMERYPDGDRPERKGRCFPAGHSSGGFALMGLLWLRSSRRWRVWMIALGLAAGWWMGGYQILKGAHYMSHTLVTMLLAGCIVLAWRCVLGTDRQSLPE